MRKTEAETKTDSSTAGAVPLLRPAKLPPASHAAALLAFSYTAYLDACVATASKRGRTPLRPYVPIIRHPVGSGWTISSQRTEQVRGRAFASRDEAVACAGRHIDARKEREATKANA